MNRKATQARPSCRAARALWFWTSTILLVGSVALAGCGVAIPGGPLLGGAGTKLVDPTPDGVAEAAAISLVYDPATDTEWEDELLDDGAGSAFVEAELDESLTALTEVEEDILALSSGDATTRRVIGSDDRQPVYNTTRFPFRAIGRLVCTFPNGISTSGTGALVGRRHVLTAAHVIYNSGRGGWAQSIAFIPGKSGSSEPYGRAGWVRARVYTTNPIGNFGRDVGLVTLDRSIGNSVGWFGARVQSDGFFSGAYLNTAGYPGDKGGTFMYYVYGQSGYVNSDLVVHWADTWRGQSGSPMWILIGGNRYIVAVNNAECVSCDENYGAKLSSGVMSWINSAIQNDGG